MLTEGGNAWNPDAPVERLTNAEGTARSPKRGTEVYPGEFTPDEPDPAVSSKSTTASIVWAMVQQGWCRQCVQRALEDPRNVGGSYYRYRAGTDKGENEYLNFLMSTIHSTTSSEYIALLEDRLTALRSAKSNTQTQLLEIDTMVNAGVMTSQLAESVRLTLQTTLIEVDTQISLATSRLTKAQSKVSSPALLPNKFSGQDLIGQERAVREYEFKPTEAKTRKCLEHISMNPTMPKRELTRSLPVRRNERDDYLKYLEAEGLIRWESFRTPAGRTAKGAVVTDPTFNSLDSAVAPTVRADEFWSLLMDERVASTTMPRATSLNPDLAELLATFD